MQLDDEMGGFPVQCRVVQNKEPPHFYLIFKEKLVIHTGGIAYVPRLDAVSRPSTKGGRVCVCVGQQEEGGSVGVGSLEST